MDELSKQNTEALLKRHGWTLLCVSPFEILHEQTHSKATGIAAHAIVSDLSDTENENSPRMILKKAIRLLREAQDAQSFTKVALATGELSQLYSRL